MKKTKNKVIIYIREKSTHYQNTIIAYMSKRTILLKSKPRATENT